jgi:hypothetical protein
MRALEKVGGSTTYKRFGGEAGKKENDFGCKK